MVYVKINFDEAEATIENYKNIASDSKKAIASCENKVDADLGKWEGNASNNVKASNRAAYNQVNDDFQIVEELADYEENYINIVRDADSELAGIIARC